MLLKIYHGSTGHLVGVSDGTTTGVAAPGELEGDMVGVVEGTGKTAHFDERCYQRRPEPRSVWPLLLATKKEMNK